jgi:NADH dehydrogenase
LATIGQATAIADIRWTGFDGYPAWLAWLLAHILRLAVFTNRLLDMLQWGWSFATRNRSARVITNGPARPIRLFPPLIGSPSSA